MVTFEDIMNNVLMRNGPFTIIKKHDVGSSSKQFEKQSDNKQLANNMLSGNVKYFRKDNSTLLATRYT